MSNQPEIQERNLGEAILDIRYCIRLNHLLRRFFRRLDAIISGVELIAGTAVFVSFFQENPEMAVKIALCVAVASMLNRVIKPAEKAYQADELYRRYEQLRSQADQMTLSEVDAAMSELRQMPVSDIEGLRNVAYNDNLRESGFAGSCVKETALNSLWRAFA